MSNLVFFYGNQPYEFRRQIKPEDIIYTKEDILDQLHFKHGANKMKFRYDLLDKNERRKKSLTNVVSGEISMAAFAEVKRTARFKMADIDSDIDWLNDRLQPFCMLEMPNGTYVEWSLGIFILSSPNRVEENEMVFREIEAYDKLIILKDDKFLNRYMIAEGTSYIDAINTLLNESGLTKINIEASNAILNKAKEFEPGTEILKAINDLLKEINWTTLTVDEQGYFTSSRYRSPSERASNIRYYDDELSILNGGMSEDLDLVNIANSWVVVASNPEEEPLVSSYQNDNADSPTSTISRGRVIADYREIESIASQEALNAYVERLAFNASQIYGYLEFETAINPFHSYSDVIAIRNKILNIEDKYSETNWTMNLVAGTYMRHSVRKVVRI